MSKIQTEYVLIGNYTRNRVGEHIYEETQIVIYLHDIGKNMGNEF